MLATEALSLNVEYRGIVKNPVQRAQQSIVLIEVAAPLRRILVAGKHEVEVTFLVVPTVNQVKEQPGILFVELTVPYLINNRAGWPYQSVENGSLFTGSSGCSKFVPQLGHFNEGGFNSTLTALIANGLCQMGFTCSSRANECQILVGADRDREVSAFSLSASQPFITEKSKFSKVLGSFRGNRLSFKSVWIVVSTFFCFK